MHEKHPPYLGLAKNWSFEFHQMANHVPCHATLYPYDKVS